MKNWEKHFDGILNVLSKYAAFDTRTGRVVPCVLDCENCSFHNGCSYATRREWLLAEEKKESVQMTQDEKSYLQVLYDQGYRFIARDYFYNKCKDENYSFSVFTEAPINACPANCQSVGQSNYYWVVKGDVSEGIAVYLLDGWYSFVKPEKPLEIKRLLDCPVVRENRTVAENATVEGSDEK